MPRLLTSLASLSLASIALSSPLQARQYGASPCAAVAASVATQAAIGTPTVPAQLAYDCITSVPFNQSAALALVDGVKPYFRWQSNTVWLKDPPAEYAEKVQPGIDVWGGLEKIRGKVVSGEYENEYAVSRLPCLVKRLQLTCRSVWIRALYTPAEHARWPLRICT
jgi:hypothetical protein